MKKVAITSAVIVVALLSIILGFQRTMYGRKNITQKKVYSSPGVSVTVDRTEFRQNEEVLLDLSPSKGYLSVIRYGSAMNVGTSVSEGIQKLQTLSYGPGEVDIEVWKVDNNGEIVFFTQGPNGDWMPNQPELKFKIRISK